jgi:hypothetical protein
VLLNSRQLFFIVKKNLELGGSSGKEELCAGNHTGSPDAGASKCRHVVGVKNVHNVEQHSGGNEEGRIRTDSLFGNTSVKGSKLCRRIASKKELSVLFH